MGRRTVAAVVVLSALGSPCAVAQPKPVREFQLEPDGRVASSSQPWVGFSPDGKYLVTRHTDLSHIDRIRAWRLSDGARTADLAASPTARASSPCAFTADGRLAFIDGQTVRVQDVSAVAAWRTERTLTFPEPDATTGGFGTPLVWAPDDGRHVYRADWIVGQFGSVTVRRWGPDKPNAPELVVAPDRLKTGLADATAFDPVRGRLAVYDTTSVPLSSRNVQVYDLSSGKDIGLFKHPEMITALGFGRGGDVLAVGHALIWHPRQAVRLWDLTTGRRIADHPMPLRVHCLALSADGKQLACGFRASLGIATLWLFDAASGNELGRADADRVAVERVCFDPTGRLLATVGYDGAVRVWDADKLNTRGR